MISNNTILASKRCGSRPTAQDVAGATRGVGTATPTTTGATRATRAPRATRAQRAHWTNNIQLLAQRAQLLAQFQLLAFVSYVRLSEIDQPLN